ncbi:hypothetical protein P7C73_g1213, partial [Tremellales sp. Uapishka_1]
MSVQSPPPPTDSTPSMVRDVDICNLTIPLLLPASDKTTYIPSFHFTYASPSRFVYAVQIYGAQMQTPSTQLSSSLTGRLSAKTFLRKLQINILTTSGTTPTAGIASGYARIDTTMAILMEKDESAFKGWTKGEGDAWLASIMPFVSSGIRHCVLLAAREAAAIRCGQLFFDGNHRTALLTMILILAESHIVVCRNFDLFKVYIILSARAHENDIGAFETNDIETVAQQVYSYVRHHVKLGNPTYDDLTTLAERIRTLPLTVSVVEETYQTLTKSNSNQNKEEWACLSPRMKDMISWAHPDFKVVP